MKYTIYYTREAKEHIKFHYKSGNKSVVRKIADLIAELAEHPQTGTGKPEQLKHGLSGKWSRRISGEHRLIYSIEDEKVIVEVISAKGHY